MFSNFLQILPIITIKMLAVMIAIVAHEVAHGYVAYKLGDHTAKNRGRLSFNPLKHIDLFGSIIFPAILIMSAGVAFGWAKPVPVNFNKLKNVKRDTILVASAGIVTNIYLAIIAALLLHLSSFIPYPLIQAFVSLFFLNLVGFNIILALFNILPIPPLDGSKIFFGSLDYEWAQKYVDADRQGMFMIVFLAFILPTIGNKIGVDLNFFGSYLINSSKFFISLLL